MRKMRNSGIEWIGQIPTNWDVVPHKRVMHKVKEICEQYNGEDIISLTMNGVIKRDLTAGGKMPTSFDGYQYVKPNDLLLCLFDIDVTPRCVGVVKDYGVTSPAYSRFVIHDGYYNAYYDYLLRAIDDDKVFVHLSKNLRSSLTENDFGAIKTCVPPLAEQERIAAFLDTECAEIDAVLEKTRASIEEYKKLKQAVITQAVTKGIRGDRPMKDSGIEWIGDIPAEWDVIRNAFLYKEKSRLPEENAVSLSLSQVDGLIATDDMKERSLKTSTYDGWKQVRTNDLVLNRFKGHLGVLFAANIEGMVSFHYGVYEPLRQFDSKFFEYLYHSDAYKAILGLKSNGMTIGLQNLSNQNFYSVYSLYPPEEEQQEIIQYLDDKCSSIDALVVQKQEHLTEIENYKKSLIYEYVTGKKEVKTSVLAD